MKQKVFICPVLARWGAELTGRTLRLLAAVRIWFVFDLNLHRRHLNESQRAAVAAKIANLKEEHPSKEKTA